MRVRREGRVRKGFGRWVVFRVFIVNVLCLRFGVCGGGYG